MNKRRTFILSCAGCANVGQLANMLALEAVRHGFGASLCLAGIGAHRSGFIRAARDNETILIDGCATGCGRAIFEHAEIPIGKYLCLTELGIEKNFTGDLTGEDIEKARLARKELLNDNLFPIPASGTGTEHTCCS